MRRLLLAALALGFAFSTTASAAPCRDSTGKFTKCATVAKPKKCRDAKGKFAKCGATASLAAAAKTV